MPRRISGPTNTFSRNVTTYDILMSLASLIRTCGLPYIVAGDFQNPPAMLVSTRFLQQLGPCGATVRAPTAPTERSTIFWLIGGSTRGSAW